MKRWIYPSLMFLAAVIYAISMPIEAAVTLLGGAAFLWVLTVYFSKSAEGWIKSQPMHQDKYWPDGELDALETYAVYWRNPVQARYLAKACRGVVGALLGASIVWIFFAWGLSAVAMLFCVGLIKKARQFDPVSWLDDRKEQKDYSLSGEWEDVMNLREKLIQEGWPWPAKP